jgi:hypothetical protein
MRPYGTTSAMLLSTTVTTHSNSPTPPFFSGYSEIGHPLYTITLSDRTQEMGAGRRADANCLEVVTVCSTQTP